MGNDKGRLDMPLPNDHCASLRRQRGVTLSGLLMVLVVLGIVATFGFKLVPSYIQYFSVQQALVAMSKDPGLKDATPAEYRAAFDKRASVDNITAVSSSDLQFAREGGATEMSVTYSVKVPLAGNASICIDFVATSSVAD